MIHVKKKVPVMRPHWEDSQLLINLKVSEIKIEISIVF